LEDCGVPRIRRRLTICLLAGVGIAAAGCVRDAALAAEPQRSIAPPTTGTGQVSTRNTIQKVEYAIVGARTLIRVRFRDALRERPPVLVGYHPTAYIALDLADTISEARKETIEVGERELRSVQLVPGDNRVRLIMKLARPAPYEMEVAGRELLITLHRPQTVTLLMQ
jgi:hypothetical protein